MGAPHKVIAAQTDRQRWEEQRRNCCREKPCDVLVEARADLAREREARTAAEKSWRCFQCGDVFADEAEARLHFDGEPACVDPLRGDEAARLDEVRRLRDEVASLRREVEEADYDRGELASYRSEIGRLFGECGCGLASTPHQAWLKYEAATNERDAANERATRAEAENSRLREALRESLALLERAAKVLNHRFEYEAAWLWDGIKAARAALGSKEGE